MHSYDSLEKTKKSSLLEILSFPPLQGVTDVLQQWKTGNWLHLFTNQKIYLLHDEGVSRWIVAVGQSHADAIFFLFFLY